MFISFIVVSPIWLASVVSVGRAGGPTAAADGRQSALPAET
jgi:hypothetical protein